MLGNFKTIKDAFLDTVEKYPDKTAIIYQGTNYTYAEVDRFAEKIAAYFNQKGLKKQERVILYLPHMPEWINIWLAMQRLGVAVLPVTHFYGHGEISYMANDSGTRIIFCGEKNFDQVAKASESHHFDKIIIVGDNYDKELAKQVAAKDTEIISYTDVINAATAPLPDIQVEPTDLAEVLYTGGTTGFPKGVPLTNTLLMTAMRTKRGEFDPILPYGTGVALQGAPLFHILGKELGISSLLSGDALILLAKMDVEDIFKNIESYKVTTFFSTPTLLRMMLDHENVDKYSFDSLVYVFAAGEALPPEVNKRWLERVKRPIYQGYGSTETCGGISGTPVGVDFPFGTIGKIVPTKKTLLYNPDTEAPAAPGETGELFVSSEDMVTAYLNKPEETAAHFVQIDGKTWYKTGDIVRFDENGWLFFVDRSVDMIKSKGYRVAATKVESAVYKFEAVSECCAVGIPDEKEGEKLKVFVVLREGFEGTKPEDITAWCKDKLSSYEVPYLVEFTKELPKSPVGKILRRKLRDAERELYAKQKQG